MRMNQVYVLCVLSLGACAPNMSASALDLSTSALNMSACALDLSTCALNVCACAVDLSTCTCAPNMSAWAQNLKCAEYE